MVHSDRVQGFHRLDRGGSGDVHKAEGVTRRAFSYGRPLTAKKLSVELYGFINVVTVNRHVF